MTHSNSPQPLVRAMFNGPIDIVGDIHGEIAAFEQLLEVLGYDGGQHPEGRRLVFLGDLVDRGPDSLAVVDRVRKLVQSNAAQCILGNHELNLMLGRRRHGNAWFFGEPESLDKSGRITPQRLADEAQRQELLAFFATLPLVLERDDIRAVHACWNVDAVEAVRPLHNTLATFHEHSARIEAFVQANNIQPIAAQLRHQLENPVKLLTSGPERRRETSFEASGATRYLERVRWWKDYRDDPYCLFGHYAVGPCGRAGDGNTVCADFGIAGRWRERLEHGAALKTGEVEFATHLAAARFPEQVILLEDGRSGSFDDWHAE